VKKPENSLYPPDWLRVAKKDWHRIKIMMDAGDIEAAGYFLQQSVEALFGENQRRRFLG